MGIGVWQVILILVIVLIIFGAGKLPRVMGDVAKGVKNFKAGMAAEDAPAKPASESAGPAPSVEAPTEAAAESAESKEDAAKS